MARNMSRPERHASTASSGADSWTSQETIKGMFGSRRHTPNKITTDNDARHDNEISPGSIPEPPPPRRPSRAPSNMSAIAPWDTHESPEPARSNHDPASGHSGNGKLPQIPRQPPITLSSPAPNHPWRTGNGNPLTPGDMFSSFYDDSSEEVSQLSPGFRPGSSQEDMGYPQDRRPSVASATTISSVGSKSSMSRNYKKKLGNFFGDDFPGVEEASRQNSESSLAPNVLPKQHNGSVPAPRRKNSISNNHSLQVSRPVSPATYAARPKTPHISTEVTPWEFQDSNSKDLPPPPPQNAAERGSLSRASKSHHHHHRLHLPGHRHTRSKDEERHNDQVPSLVLRPAISREDTTHSYRRDTQPNTRNPSQASIKPTLTPRPPSPTPSNHSLMMKGGGPKPSLFDRLRGNRGKTKERSNTEALQNLPGSTTSLTPSKAGKVPKADYTLPPKKRSITSNALPHVIASNAKDSRTRPLFKSKKSDFAGLQSRNPNEAKTGTAMGNALFHLDTDFTDMSDIINTRPQMTPPMTSEIFDGSNAEDTTKQIEAATQDDSDTGGWDAPDSWAVKKAIDENEARLQELDDEGDMHEEATGPPFCVRIFRADGTFAVLSVPLNTTVADIIGLIRKKSFLQDDIDNYLIVMKKHDVSRQLERNERPLVIQRRLLEQAGYNEADRIEDVGREDNSYLCRFTFLPQKSAGYTSLDKDPELEEKAVARFSHVDLQAKNLVTIPVVLHKKANDIVSLNLSRNLAIDVPKDFVQACGNLREIKFCSNEAWRIPPSFVHASRLTMLDMSTNRIDQLEHTELQRLSTLASLRMANNKLTALPRYFGQFKFMRSLNISSNGFTQFPEPIREIVSMVDLDISFNEISDLPDIGTLVHLERFWATNNKLTGSFPSSTANLVNLRECDIRHNALDSIDVFCQLPKLEYLMVGYNHISSFEGTFPKIRGLFVNNNPITRFDFTTSIPTITNLMIEKAKLAALPDDLFQKVPNLVKLVLDKNHFVSISPNIGKLTRLEHLSVAQNTLSSLPAEIGWLVELRYLDLRENNLSTLPPQLWFARKLETLNLSSNVLSSFPKPGAPLPSLPEQHLSVPAEEPDVQEEELDRLSELGYRRPSIAQSASSLSSSPGPQSRKGSIASQIVAARKPSMVSRGSDATTATLMTMAPISRKDSSLSSRLVATFAGSLRHLLMADNRLQDEVFDELSMLPELRVLNLSYNILYDLPPRTLRRWTHLDELYLSGNDLRSLPAEDLDEVSSLRVLHINCNKFQVLPAELAKVSKLAIMDVGSNALKYNVSNWPYDWNWNWNHQLKYLNMSGNTRLEIKPGSGNKSGRYEKDLTDFSSLPKLRVLGLMDVTLRSTVPDQTEDRRVRTAGSQVGSMSYGMADALGRNEHLSTMDMVVDRFRSHEDEVLVGMFDAPALSMGGSKIVKYLYENFKHRFADELEKKRDDENATDALRRAFLGLNKEVAIAIMQPREQRQERVPGSGRNVSSIPDLADEDLSSGCVATVLFIKEMTLYVSNVGDATAVLVDSDGGHKVITRKHDPTEPSERQRIREAGGFVSRNGKMNDQLEVSRAFGYILHSPSMIAAPHTSQVNLTESHEMIIIASRELWQFMSKEFAVDMARTERGDLMRAAQKLRDLAIAFGASGKIMVMVIGVSDLRKKERLQVRTPSMSMSPSGLVDDYLHNRRGRRDKNAANDSRLARLDQEVDPPTGQVTLVFTDIKNSTVLWETYPIAMRSAIKMHNDCLRRQLRIIGGYEVKTEGDAFIVSFPTVTSALLWTFTSQMMLLTVQWPTEILNSVHGSEVCDADGNVIFRGLSVRMGIHWGAPVCEVDPVTKRMDYFGPMVNRSARISGVADGGQITVSAEFIAEVQRLLETHVDNDRSGSLDSGEDTSFIDNAMAEQIKRELRSLSSQGFEVKELGERRLKGLENPEYIYLMYPHALSGRLIVQQQRAEAQAARSAVHPQAKHTGDHSSVDVDNVWDLCTVALRLESLCSALENPGGQVLKAVETPYLEKVKEGGGEITDRFLLNIVEHQVSRIETCINTLWLRNMVRPFENGVMAQACPMADIFKELTVSLNELRAMKGQSRMSEPVPHAPEPEYYPYE